MIVVYTETDHKRTYTSRAKEFIYKTNENYRHGDYEHEVFHVHY
jgi:hypothetical protein